MNGVNARVTFITVMHCAPPSVVKCHMLVSQLLGNLAWGQYGGRWVRVVSHVRRIVQFLTLFFSSAKSQYTAQIKTLPLKCGEYRYFDVSSLNEERYGMANSSSKATNFPSKSWGASSVMLFCKTTLDQWYVHTLGIFHSLKFTVSVQSRI